ncbi:MAG: hypothetical protein UU73_C0001G0133 [Candidatus Daviesbacteria bacterium GW2011_GWA1_41_61]|uniref:Bacterial membrane protein YfhO n=1 Tax=Candidatus Daviesbacteria bacterium GW2011_GWA2_40_9 TaxID=1618424 RepID=A0A0G0X5V6_9BACT|nr:MAG: hypothetical protein UU26_C0001G0032 [Candidatus Daviesbacteria bacterium GW2011_GWC1_40_9]KKR83027.1 MAG: hypothetical protein UU29_C0008G0136 [Candidatus Daviesbacteria bacterium GW2011_GWA2_40_9]KKR92952.1 MAG: hypothetical protein UU44_C0004G0134 [Candidatus Daviesbacteria bacterium GW2011_GWB1_41_15]KKS15496.1 MAG: hypothetical protein UU73_C0001G0133 [Candidatus Daviesbacteria bacterium GW2011_GWA1_41_61]
MFNIISTIGRSIGQLLSKFYPQLILLLLPIIFFYPVFLGYVLFPGAAFINEFYPGKDLPQDNSAIAWSTEKFYGSDPMTAHYPWKLIGIEMMKKGEWPLWNPYSFAGSPLLANNQSALLDPLNVFYLMFDFVTAWNINIILQVVLTGLFCYYLLRDYKLTKFSALWGGMIYAWNGYLANYLHIQVIGHVLIWLPLSILLLRKINREKKLVYFWLLVFSITSIFLSGYLQTTAYALVIIFIFCLICCRTRFFTMVLAFIVSLGLSSVQILPTLEFINKSQRSAAFFYDTFSFLAQPGQLIRFLMPRFFGHPNSENWWGGMLQRDHSYIGVLGIIFALVGIYFVLKNKEFKFWLFLLIFFIIFTVESPLTKFIYDLPIPLLNSVTPSRSLGMVVFPLSILSALGIEKFILAKHKVGKITLIALISLLIIALISALCALFNFPTAQNIQQIIKQSFFYLMVLCLLFSSLVVIYFKKILPTFLILGLLFSLQTTDLLKENKFFTRLFTSSQQLYPQTELTDFLIKHSESRFLSLDLWLLIPNSFLPYHLYTITSYDALHLQNSAQFVEAIFKNIPQTYLLDPRSIRFSNLNTNLASMLNIRFFLSLSPLAKTDFNFIGKIGSAFIYENPGVLPYGFLVDNFQITDEKQQLSAMFDPTTDFSKSVFLYEKPLVSISPDNKGSVNLLQRGYRSVEWSVFTPEPQILFIAETYDDGWQAYIDGEKTKVYQANGVFQAVAVPSGKHTVKLFYNPGSFQIGLFISGTTLLLLFLVIALRPDFFQKNHTHR